MLLRDERRAFQLVVELFATLLGSVDSVDLKCSNELCRCAAAVLNDLRWVELRQGYSIQVQLDQPALDPRARNWRTPIGLPGV